MGWFQNGVRDFLGLNRLLVDYNTVDIADYSPEAFFLDQSGYGNKIKTVFSNPAVLKVFSLQCNLFSLGKIYVYENEKALVNDPFLKLVKHPNPFQGESQFLWDYMFWKMLGNGYCYADSKIVTNEKNKLYWLDTSKMTFPPEMDKMKDKIILSDAAIKDIGNFRISYRYADGSATSFPWSNILHFPDLTNGSGNWFGGSSKIDALYKAIGNSEASLNAKNINIRMSGKFMVSGKNDANDVTKMPMSGAEKEDIELKVNGQKSVHAVTSLIDIKRFVENIGALRLDESYLADYFLIGSMYDIPRDVLEAYNSSTYENQEKARGAHVSYTLAPAAQHICGSMQEWFGYDSKTIVMDWEHLPFMQVFAKERAETTKVQTESLLNLMKCGVPLSEINSTLDTNFTVLDYEAAQRTGAGVNQSGGQGN